MTALASFDAITRAEHLRFVRGRYDRWAAEAKRTTAERTHTAAAALDALAPGVLAAFERQTVHLPRAYMAPVDRRPDPDVTVDLGRARAATLSLRATAVGVLTAFIPVLTPLPFLPSRRSR